MVFMSTRRLPCVHGPYLGKFDDTQIPYGCLSFKKEKKNDTQILSQFQEVHLEAPRLLHYWDGRPLLGWDTSLWPCRI